MTTKLSADDEREIEALIVRYATAIDRRDWPLFRTCFTHEVRADYGPFGSWSDADGFTESMRTMHLHKGPTLHQMSNIVSAATEAGATARTYVNAVLMDAGPDGSFDQAYGFYEDELVRTETGWRISNRHFVAVRISKG